MTVNSNKHKNLPISVTHSSNRLWYGTVHGVEAAVER